MNGNNPGVQQTAGTPYNAIEMQFLQTAGQMGQLGEPMPGADGFVYMGPDYEDDYKPGAYVGSTVGKDRQGTAMFPIERAVQEYYFLDDEQYAELVNLTSQLIGYDARKSPQNIMAKWQQGVTGAAAYSKATNRNVSPFGFLRMEAERQQRLGFGMPGGGGGGGGGGSRAIVNLTNAANAEVLVTNALKGVLGRAATDKEVKQFLRTLNREERRNPVVSTSGGSSGGTNPELVAQEFARSRPDAAEYLANTQYTDWLQELLSQEPMGGIESGL